MMPVIIQSEALDDIDEAFRWYDARRPGSGNEFIAELRRVIARIEGYPESFSVVHRQTRRAVLRRFPYVVYFRIIDGRAIVVACMHGRRDPRLWQER